MRKTSRFLSLFLILSFLTTTVRAQQCPWSVLNAPKKSVMYLFFPTAADATFPSYQGQPTSPVNPFTMNNHDANLSTSAVRQRTLELMRYAYCEFDVKVQLTTTPPAPAEPRWQVVGIGSDSSGSSLVGLAQDVDTGDNDSKDYCRVWAENLESFCGTELTGANSTVDRWATAIANLAAHESSHNYGAAHGEAAPNPGEDTAPNHFIANPAMGATGETIASRLNHHSDTVYERFGHDLGLAIETLHNWDFVNPNGTDADAMTIRVLSKAASLTEGSTYLGPMSPWDVPTITKKPGTLSYQGDTYNIFDVKWSVPKQWDGGADGVAPAGEYFHVGVTFQEPNAVIVYETTLHNNGVDLPLKPRMFGYDAGTTGGTFDVKFFNAHASDLILSDIRIFYLPRMVDIDEMMVGGQLLGVGGDPVIPFARRPRDGNDGITDRLAGPVRVGREPFVMPAAKLTDTRHLDKVIRRGECEQNASFGRENDVYCPAPGNVLSLFPATYTYVMATVTDPEARYWDKDARRYVDGPLSTRFFFQIAGTVPDANRNGIDDLVDIREGSSRDDNRNGVPDEAEFRRATSQDTAMGVFQNMFQPWPLAGSALR